MYFLTFVLKNLFRRKVRSLLTVVGAAVAIGAVVALVGLSNGFEESFASVFQARGVDLLVAVKGQAFQYTGGIDESVGERIRRVPGVHAVGPTLIDLISIQDPLRDVNLISVPIMGWTPDSFAFAHLKVTDGRRLEADDHNAAMLGIELARNLKQGVGDKLDVEGTEFTIVGIYQVFNRVEDNAAVVPLRDLQKAARVEGKVTGFQIVLDEAADKAELAERVKKDIEALRDDEGRSLNLAASSIKDHISGMLQTRLAHAMAWMTSAIALIIGTVGVLNTMVMSVFERTREIGILRAIGWRRARIVAMILLESVVLSLAGAVLGGIGARVVTGALSQFPAVSQYIRPDLSLVVYAQGFAVALLVGLIGGVYPAIRAALLLPTEALRHE